MIALAEFLNASPVAAFAAVTLAAELSNLGFLELKEEDPWALKQGQGYYVIRDGKSLMAFIPGTQVPWDGGLRIMASHLDSPSWKVKREAISLENGSWRIPVEPYGGHIHRRWLDRELEAAGRVSYLDSSGEPASCCWRSEKAVAIIPSLAIHLERDVNKGLELNLQTRMAALMPASPTDNPDPLSAMIAADLGILASDILSTDIFLVGSRKAGIIGDIGNQWIISGRLDNLAMAHAMLSSLPLPERIGERTILAAWFDAEEIGNKTSAGAASVFLDEMIERIVVSCGGNREDFLRSRRKSFLISTDMAHAVHPNFSEKHDEAYAPTMGGGPVIKSHGLQHYATDSVSEAKVRIAAQKTGIKLQKFIIRSDIPCGFSLGPAVAAATGIHTVDIGNPLWAMHSERETASLSDHEAMISLLRELWI